MKPLRRSKEFVSAFVLLAFLALSLCQNTIQGAQASTGAEQVRPILRRERVWKYKRERERERFKTDWNFLRFVSDRRFVKKTLFGRLSSATTTIQQVKWKNVEEGRDAYLSLCC